MAYTICGITIRTDDTGAGRQRTAELWRDIAAGKLPLLFDSEGRFLRGISPVTRYSGRREGAYWLTVLGVETAFFRRMEDEVRAGRYRKYEAAGEGDGLEDCAERAWALVRREEAAGTLRRAFTEDYESTVPAGYTRDGRPRCYLYIALEQGTEQAPPAAGPFAGD